LQKPEGAVQVEHQSEQRIQTRCGSSVRARARIAITLLEQVARSKASRLS
jgi:hypothetical protein